jgi:hypothetical protein
MMVKADINVLGDNANAIKENPWNITDTSEEAGLERNSGRMKFRCECCLKIARQNHSIKVDNRSFDNAEKLRYLGLRVINKSLIHEKLGRD